MLAQAGLRLRPFFLLVFGKLPATPLYHWPFKSIRTASIRFFSIKMILAKAFAAAAVLSSLVPAYAALNVDAKSNVAVYYVCLSILAVPTTSC